MSKNLIIFGLGVGVYAQLENQAMGRDIMLWISGLFLLFSFIFLVIRSRKRQRLLAREHLYDDYTPEEFEHLTAEIFRRLGYKATVSGKAGDRGLDVILLGKKGEKIGVQCKHYQGNIGSPMIREFAGSLDGAEMKRGYFVTTSGYTPAALDAAKSSSFAITLISGDELARIKKQVTKKQPRS